ncbi:sensor histidine kinase [Psychromarinibacter sp. S121]|uniref:sensor histidine kinase n=1 Tax=Psychromarinibacter sp. S121 TaxID=3415127 RepID=UPI003C7BCA48
MARLDLSRFRSVRLRLLTLALAPLVVLMPLLLMLGFARWTADYDRVLIANVESDLKIAEQYLSTLVERTGTDVRSLSRSTEFRTALAMGGDMLAPLLAAQMQTLRLDFLYYLPGNAVSDWPVIDAALDGRVATRIDLFGPDDLSAIDPALADRARIELIPTEAAVPTDRTEEDRGMVVHTASPVRGGGALVGGILLNRNLQFIDTINELVFLNAITGGDRQGTATLFLDDVRVSTNVRLFEDVRALGTRVSAAVRGAVLDEGRTWLDRAFVVNDWYISGYVPILDSFDRRVGMLYVGFLEAPFNVAKRAAYLWMLAAFAFVLAVSIPLFLWLAKGIFSPLERMAQTIRRVEDGDLSARNGPMRARDEIGRVAGHLDDLLDQVQERDAELNRRVEQRTAELHAANAKLEETYRQLVMSEKLASIGEITAGVAHEINNPVAVIQGNVDVMRETLGDAAKPVETELALIDRQVMRIGAIVGKLLQFARPGDYAGYDNAVDPGPLVADCLTLVEHVFAKKDITVITRFDPCPDVQIEPGELQQVVINLVVNAVQAMGDRGWLTLELGPETRDGTDGVRLAVEDTGPGIPPDRLPSVFDPFFTTKHGEGTGLGLSISQSLVQRTGGIITAENHAEGARFTVWLPAAPASEG